MDTNRICLICPYFGKFPNYIDLTFRSCKSNPTIDWLLFTDCSNYSFLPDNVKIIRTSFDDFRKRIQAAFDFPIALNKPYKLCDFKPTYGDILEEYLQGYDFWGHCDLDVIFGDLRNFCTDEILSKYDKVFTRGHLTLYRNTPAVNRYFMLPGDGYDYRDVFSDPHNKLFDEMNGVNKILAKHGIAQYQSEGLVADISTKMKKFVLGSPIINERLKNYPKQIFFWENGKTFRAYHIKKKQIVTTEIAYIHFQKRKFPEPAFKVEDSLDAFYITPDGFFEKIKKIQKYDFVAYNKGNFWGILPYYNKLVIKKIKNRLNRFRHTIINSKDRD